MSILEVVALAIVQGMTEFLPISSSGHIVLGVWVLDIEDPGVAFDVAVHLGTLSAVLVAFRREFWSIARELLPAGRGPTVARADGISAPRRLQLLVIASIPLAIVGLAIRDELDGELRDPTWVGVFLIGTGAMLWAADRFGRRQRDLESIGAGDALRVGIMQAFAVLPGVSRSGMCMAAGMLEHLSRESAVLFAFYLAVPAVGGAGLWAAYKLATDGADAGVSLGEMALGAAVSFVVALAAIRALLALVRMHSLRVFVVYCLLAGTTVLIARASGL